MTTTAKIIFVINRGAGDGNLDYTKEIKNYFRDKPGITFRFFELSPECSISEFQELRNTFLPGIVVAVGGDGTVKFVAEQLIHSSTTVGIIPAGSANGLAADLNIPENIPQALNRILSAPARKIHLLKINNELCIHLSDIGFNARVVKKFERRKKRGMTGYLHASWRAFQAMNRMKATVIMEEQTVFRTAIMIILANATQYGTGVIVNPGGSLEDDRFEIVIVRKISLTEILKMTFTSFRPNPQKTQIFEASSVTIRTKRKRDFQIDGEYAGKVKEIHAEIIPSALSVIF